jgi:CheY-like chemotaxis protein
VLTDLWGTYRILSSEGNLDIMRINPNEVIRNYIDSGKKVKILISEDELINQRFLEVTMRKLGFSCDLSCDGNDTLDKIRKNHYDIVLLDMQLPILSGEEVLASMKEEGLIAQSFIIAQTAHSHKKDIDRYLSLGCRSHISKPISWHKLKKGIAEAILQMSGK